MLAVQRDSPNCKKHSEKNNSHEREHDLRRDLKLRMVVTESLTRSSKKRNLVRKSNESAVVKDQGNVQKGKDWCLRQRNWSLRIEKRKDPFDLNSVYNFNETEFSKKTKA